MPFNFCLFIYFCTKLVTVVCVVVIQKMTDAEMLQIFPCVKISITSDHGAFGKF